MAATPGISSSLGDSGESDNDQCTAISETTERAVLDKPAEKDEHASHHHAPPAGHVH